MALEQGQAGADGLNTHTSVYVWKAALAVFPDGTSPLYDSNE